MHILLAAARVQTPGGMSTTEMWEWIVTDAVYNYGDVVLDLIHVELQRGTNNFDLGAMMNYLNAGGSAWRATRRGLERRIDTEAQAAFDMAIQPKDPVSEELGEAWTNVYGRDPDASDAWDHAIKAVEAILLEKVLPRQQNGTLLHVIKHLETQGHLWRFGIPGAKDEYSVEPLVTMLRLLWPNPDRHADPKDRRTPALDEARAVVGLAVTIVQWARDDSILRR